MKTRINLYLPEFRPARELLTVPRLILICLIVLAVMVSWVFYVRSSITTQQVANQKMQDQITQLEVQVEVLRDRISSMQSDAALKAELEQTKNRYRSLKIIMKALKDVKTAGTIQYSSLLMELAEACSANMALEKITASGKVVSIEGKTLKGSDVPAFVERFKQLDVLHQLSFASIEVGKDETSQTPGPLSFKLTGFNPNIETKSSVQVSGKEDLSDDMSKEDDND